HVRLAVQERAIVQVNASAALDERVDAHVDPLQEALEWTEGALQPVSRQRRVHRTHRWSPQLEEQLLHLRACLTWVHPRKRAWRPVPPSSRSPHALDHP